MTYAFGAPGVTELIILLGLLGGCLGIPTIAVIVAIVLLKKRDSKR